MPFILAAVFSSLAGWFGAGSDDFICKHQEWTARHMQEQLGWSLRKGRQVASNECRKGIDSRISYK